MPTLVPTLPSSQPSRQPSGQPSIQPSSQPTRQPTGQPTRQLQPTCHPTGTRQPSMPTFQPSAKPTFSLGHMSVIRTEVGTGFAGSSGDGGLALNGRITSPVAVCLDSVGNLYVAEQTRIRKVDTSGIVTLFAGAGLDSASDNAATSTFINTPYQLFCSTNGRLYFTEFGAGVVRYVGTTTGIVRLVAGSYGATASSGDGGAATSAGIPNPVGLWLDTMGQVYVTEFLKNKIRRKNLDDTMTLIAGNGNSLRGDGGLATAAGLKSPMQLFGDTTSRLFCADFGNANIRSIDLLTGLISSPVGIGVSVSNVPSPGAISSSGLMGPSGVFADRNGVLYIAEMSGNRIKKVDSGMLTTVAGTGFPPSNATAINGDGGPPTSATIYTPYFIHVSDS
eukprot:gene26729-33353_t